MSFKSVFCSSLAVLLLSATASAGPAGFDYGPVSLKSVGPMTFATSGVLLIGDPEAAAVYAIDTEDTASTKSAPKNIDDLTKTLAAALEASDVQVGELAVNEETGATYISVVTDGKVRLVKIVGDKVTEVNLDKVNHASTQLANAPEDREVESRGRRRNPRQQSITDLAFFEGKVMVTGMAAGDSPSRVLEIPFPFAENSVATSVEIFHAAHGRVEDATIRTFLPITIDGEPSLLAGFTCTPLVRFPVNSLDGSGKVRGTTVAELGNRNTPLDMVIYEKDGTTAILMSNSARGMMKITTDGIADREGLTEPVRGGGTAGQPFERVESLDNVQQMDKLDNDHAVAIVDNNGSLSLKTIDLP
ncbi:hypothetical protein FYK55_15885 [Roseiconus nitratireducens]|uniref:Uncharacterized protein n=1 Tax=Roseiconus nitratireducens TaxID=2605748 RepID=A0A5M6D8P2_9BACT|nr:hypothetical protein [Roseiconus nitratireducens]KAA5542279.1 hypothetical protein FYK55_15885 [Roseiconus nitratireducens]